MNMTIRLQTSTLCVVRYVLLELPRYLHYLYTLPTYLGKYLVGSQTASLVSLVEGSIAECQATRHAFQLAVAAAAADDVNVLRSGLVTILTSPLLSTCIYTTSLVAAASYTIPASSSRSPRLSATRPALNTTSANQRCLRAPP